MTFSRSTGWSLWINSVARPDSRFSPMVERRWLLMRRSAEKLLSAVADVTGRVRKILRSRWMEEKIACCRASVLLPACWGCSLNENLQIFSKRHLFIYLLFTYRQQRDWLRFAATLPSTSCTLFRGLLCPEWHTSPQA